MEMGGIHVKDVNNPSKNYPKAVFIGAAITVIIFVLGTFSLGIIIPAKDISLTQSLLVGFDNYFHYIRASWLSPIIAIALAFGVLAGVLTWVAGPSKGIFAVGKAGYMPPFFQKTNKLGVQKKEGTKNYFIIDGDEFEPAYNGDNTPYHMYFQRKDEYVGFAGKLTDVLNPKRPAAQDRSESTLMDDIWAGAPFKDRAAFIKKVQEVTKTYQDEGLLSSRDRQVVLLASARGKMS